MKLVATRKSEQNLAVLDPWTMVHFAAGLAAGLTNMGFVPVFVAAVGYEFVENAAEKRPAVAKFFQTSGPEILPNAVADVAVMSLGWYLGQRWNKG
ncbi:MAG: hypothetical protein ACYTFN_14735 [Planctomycetota bacterium]|jgi:hypothetical protein